MRRAPVGGAGVEQQHRHRPADAGAAADHDHHAALAGHVVRNVLRHAHHARWGEQYEYTPKRGVTFTLTAADLVRRLVALVPPPRAHLTSFHGSYGPHAKLRPLLTATRISPPPPKPQPPKSKPKRRRLDWASLYQHTFGNDVLGYPCGGRRTIRALFSTHKAAEERFAALGRRLPSRLLPDATAPPQLCNRTAKGTWPADLRRRTALRCERPEPRNGSS